ncbi:MAG: response regulator [Chloroflexi bacterium]|nr:response regulator [Chloroflexota bacterium]
MPDFHDSQIASWQILIVDDEPDNLHVPMQLFQTYGATVLIAEDGERGLQALDRLSSPTFVLLDLSMPVMDGWEMLKRLRADDRYRDLPVIALTAHAMVGDAEKALQAGFDGYVTKPFILQNLIDDIKAILSQEIG